MVITYYFIRDLIARVTTLYIINARCWYDAKYLLPSFLYSLNVRFYLSEVVVWLRLVESLAAWIRYTELKIGTEGICTQWFPL